MSGYHGHSMSNNAVDAYDSGMMPLSKWTKAAIIWRAKEYDCSPQQIALLEELPLDILKHKALECKEWHHTSGAYNRTDFYDLNIDFIEELNEETVKQLILDRIRIRELLCDEPEELKEERWYAEWDEFIKHGSKFKRVSHSGEGVVRGNWFYLPDGSKKNINGAHFCLIRQLNKKKKGRK